MPKHITLTGQQCVVVSIEAPGPDGENHKVKIIRCIDSRSGDITDLPLEGQPLDDVISGLTTDGKVSIHQSLDDAERIPDFAKLKGSPGKAPSA